MNIYRNKIFSFTGIYKYLLQILFLGFLSCENEEQFSHPIIHTGEVTDISSDGAMFYGRLVETGSEEIAEHGFLWGRNRQLSFDNDSIISLGIFQDNTFSFRLRRNLKLNETFYLRAFARTVTQKTLLGRIVPFSNSTPPPEAKFEKLIPEAGLWGDTLKIYGENFTTRFHEIIVLFDDETANVLYATESEIHFLVPDFVATPEPSISLVVEEKTYHVEHDFTILPPVINSFSPYAVNGGEIIINGRGFHPEKNHNNLYYGDIQLDVVTREKDHLIARFPTGLEHQAHPIILDVIGQKVATSDSLQLYNPWRKLMKPPHQGVKAVVGFQINDRLFAGGGRSSTNMYYFKDLWEYFPEEDRWEQRASAPDSFWNDLSFTTQNFGYVHRTHGESPFPIERLLYQYNPESNQWNIKSGFTGPPTMYRISSFNIPEINSGFIVGGMSYDNYSEYYHNTVFQYSENTDTWQNKGSVPPAALANGIAFSYNNTGFAGIGAINHIESDFNIYEYDHISNTWTAKISLAGYMDNTTYGLMNTITLQLDDKVYIIGGRQVTSYNPIHFEEMYEYCITTNQIRKLPVKFKSTSANHTYTFTYNGKGYIGGADLWEFDPQKLPPDNE